MILQAIRLKAGDYGPKEFYKASVRLRIGGSRDNDGHRASLCRNDACKGEQDKCPTTASRPTSSRR